MKLTPATAAQWPPDIDRPMYDRPMYDRDAQKIEVVHLGIGAFHRAHQAMVAERRAL